MESFVKNIFVHTYSESTRQKYLIKEEKKIIEEYWQKPIKLKADILFLNSVSVRVFFVNFSWLNQRIKKYSLHAEGMRKLKV